MSNRTVIPSALRLDRVELPALAECGLQQFVRFTVVGDAHLVRVVLKLAS